MFQLLDYIHYRIYKFSKERNDNAPETNGTLILALILCFSTIDLVVLVHFFIRFDFPNKFAFLPLLILFGGFSWLRYEKDDKYLTYHLKWHSESRGVALKKGWLLSCFMMICFLTPFIYGYLTVNMAK